MNPRPLADRVEELEGRLARIEAEFRFVRYVGGLVATIITSVLVLLITGAIAH